MDFQPFSVTCVTCSSRLRVSRKELVGNIVACPKCQSMVQLTPPKAGPTGAAAIEMGNQQVDSQALTEDSIGEADVPDAAQQQPQFEGAQPQDAVPPGPSGHDSLRRVARAEPPPVFSDQPAHAAPTGEAPETPESAAPDTTPSAAPPPNWHSQKNAASRRIAMWVAVVLASIVSASILFAVLRRSRSGEQQQVSTGSGADVETADAETIVDSPEEASTRSDDVPTDATSAGAPDSDNQTSEPDETGQPDETDSAQKSAATDDPQTDIPGDNDSPTGEPLQPPADLLGDSPLLSGSPLDSMTPVGSSPLETSPLGGNSDPADETGTLTELPKELQSLLNGLTAIDRPQFTETQPAPQTIDEIQLDRASEVDVDLEVAIEAPDAANMRQALGLNIALQTSDPNGYPLNDLMLFLSQLSGVPIEVEWVSYDIVGLPIHSRVKLPNGWPTLEDLLTAVCTATDSTFDKNARTITLRPTDQRFNQAVADILDLSDLAPEDASAVTLARTLLGQTEGDPSRVSIPTEGGPAQLAVFVCEAIRRSRGAPGKLPDPLFARWGGTYKNQVSAWPELNGGVSGPPRIQAATIASLIRQIAKLNGVTCYVNWQDAARRDLQPTDQQMPRTGEGVSAADALNQVLNPSGMLVRVVDSQHWWVGSDASHDRFPVVVWFDDADGEATQKRVELVLQGAAVNEQIVGAAAVDPESQKCVAILPRYLLRQLPRMLHDAK